MNEDKILVVGFVFQTINFKCASTSSFQHLLWCLRSMGWAEQGHTPERCKPAQHWWRGEASGADWHTAPRKGKGSRWGRRAGPGGCSCCRFPARSQWPPQTVESPGARWGRRETVRIRWARQQELHEDTKTNNFFSPISDDLYFKKHGLNLHLMKANFNMLNHLVNLHK